MLEEVPPPPPVRQRTRSWASLKNVLRSSSGHHHHHHHQSHSSSLSDPLSHSSSARSPSSAAMSPPSYVAQSTITTRLAHGTAVLPSSSLSPPEDLAAITTALDRLPEDEYYSPPIDATPPSPGTPQKVWERQYRSFLKSRLKRSSSKEGGGGGDALDDTLHHNQQQQQQHASTLEEASVRGGQFFASVFANKSSSQLHHRRAKSRSQDELDGTMRHGSGKKYSMPPPPAAPTHNMSSSLPNFLLLHKQKSQSRSMGKHQSGGGGSSMEHLQQFLQPQPIHTTTSTSSTPPTSLLHKSLQETRPQHKPTTISTDMTASAMKRAFTEFHNSNVSGRDAASAYLGDEPSHRHTGGPSILARQNQAALIQSAMAATNLQDDTKLLSSSLGALATTTTPPRVHKNAQVLQPRSYSPPMSPPPSVELQPASSSPKRMLKPLMAVEAWQNGRRYVIAPAVWRACPVSVMGMLTKESTILTPKQVCSNIHGLSPFGTIVLGECQIQSGVSPHQGDMNGSLQQKQQQQQWSTCLLVLRQNYLLEYDVNDPVTSLPRGYAQLQYATCYVHPDREDLLELDFYGSPCAKTDQRRLLIRVSNAEERRYWLKCINAASALRIKDLYMYDENQPLGTGSYSSVFAAKRTGPLNARVESCAIKIFDKNLFWRCVIKGRERADTIVREVSVQATLTAKGGNVSSFLKIRGFFETTDHVVIESELLDGTDLFRYISSRPPLTEPEAAAILHKILLCLQAMNRIGMAHRDIKPANILVHNTNKRHDAIKVKVADFGLATFMGVDGRMSGRCGTPGFVACEVLQAEVHGSYSNKVDVFSAGVTLYVMLCGYEPFYGETDTELIRANKDALIEFPDEEWKRISPAARDLVERMMRASPDERLSVDQAMSHPWMREHIVQCVEDATTPLTGMPAHDACIVS